MKEMIIDFIKGAVLKTKDFSIKHPYLSLFLFGIIVGLMIAFVF
jgi:hypothetical protein